LSPRSKEFCDRARKRLEGARKNLGQGENAIAASAATYLIDGGAEKTVR
jgi:hypothetical protein